MQLLLGADPEYFLKENGKNISAHGLIKGDKNNPLPVKNGAVQIDGTAVEFNIDPSENQKQFVKNIDIVLSQLRDMIPKHLQFDFSPVANYDKEYFDTVPKQAKILGCEPDFNAYTGEKNPQPDENVIFRTGAGHIHFGYTNGVPIHNLNHFNDCRTMSAHADFFIGMPLAILEPTNIRAELYGKAGAFRPKHYGFEYRSPSNYWLNSKFLKKEVYNQSKKMFYCVTKHGFINNFDFYKLKTSYNHGYKSNLFNIMLKNPQYFSDRLIGMCAKAVRNV